MKEDRANGDTAKPDSSTWAARQIVRGADRGALGTLQRDRDGHPHVSLVALATTPEGAPLLLISTLSEHTRNLAADDRASLLVSAPAISDDPLADARVTLMGRVVADDHEALRARHLRRHPAASLYAGFADFTLHRFEIDRAHFVAGFGSARWLSSPGDLAAAPLFANDEEERAALDRLAGVDHPLLVRIATQHIGQSGVPPTASMTATGIDREGVDLRAGPRTARVTFQEPVVDLTKLGAALRALARA